jgi:hypothetical protein
MLAALMGVLLCAANAGADTLLYTNLGPNGEYDTANGYFVDGANYFNQVLAEPFTPAINTNISYAELAMGHYDGNNTAVNVYLAADDGLGEPGAIMESMTQVGVIPEFANGGGLVRFNCTACSALNSGQTYWVIALEPDAASEQVWMFAYQDAFGHLAFNQNGSNSGPWIGFDGTVSGFRVYGGGGGVPEPGTFVMLGSGVLAAAGILRRKLGL